MRRRIAHRQHRLSQSLQTRVPFGRINLLLAVNIHAVGLNSCPTSTTLASFRQCFVATTSDLAVYFHIVKHLHGLCFTLSCHIRK